MIDFLLYILIRSIVGLLNALPLRVRIYILTSFARVTFFLLPQLKRISLRNLRQAFPEKDDAWREEVLKKSFSSLARLIVDFCRLQDLDANWVEIHVKSPFLPRFREIKNEHPGKGMVIVTGHLGSFELLGHCVAMYGHPISFVVRPFKLPRVHQWWTNIREAAGNRIIAREGAVREMMKQLNEGRDVAVLFDQNVTRNHAVFVNFFSQPAATTKTVALAAIRAKAPMIVASISWTGADNYLISADECDFTALYADETKSLDEKVFIITSRLSSIWETRIREHPEEWFWMHRRWKTAPEGVKEDFYN